MMIQLDLFTCTLEVLVLDVDQPLALMLQRFGAGDEGGRGLAPVLVQPFSQPTQATIANLKHLL
jgi:hypothetical protein